MCSAPGEGTSTLMGMLGEIGLSLGSNFTAEILPGFEFQISLLIGFSGSERIFFLRFHFFPLYFIADRVFFSFISLQIGYFFLRFHS